MIRNQGNQDPHLIVQSYKQELGDSNALGVGCSASHNPLTSVVLKELVQGMLESSAIDRPTAWQAHRIADRMMCESRAKAIAIR